MRRSRLQRYREHGSLARLTDVTLGRAVKRSIEVNDCAQRRDGAPNRTVAIEFVREGFLAGWRDREDCSSGVGALYGAVEGSVEVEQAGLGAYLIDVRAWLPEAVKHGELAGARHLENRPPGIVTSTAVGRAVQVSAIFYEVARRLRTVRIRRERMQNGFLA